MKSHPFLTIAVTLVSTAAIGFASPAAAVPAGPASLGDTVQKLQASGYTVVTNKTGNAPLDTCTISATRQGPTIIRMDSGVAGAGTDHTTTVVSRTVYLDLAC